MVFVCSLPEKKKKQSDSFLVGVTVKKKIDQGRGRFQKPICMKSRASVALIGQAFDINRNLETKKATRESWWFGGRLNRWWGG